MYSCQTLSINLSILLILSERFISIPSETVRKTDFLMFSGGIEMEHWLKMS